MASFELNHFLKGSISRYSYILRYGGVGFNILILEVYTSAHNNFLLGYSKF